MVKKTMYQKIYASKRQGLGKAEIALQLKLNIKTVNKYYNMTEKEFREYQKSLLVKEKTFDQFEEDILEVYESNDFNKLNMSAVYDFLEEKNGKLPGTEKSLRNYIHFLIGTNKLDLKSNTRIYSKVPELPFGKQMQLDFGEYTCKSSLRLYILAAILSASRYKYVVFQDRSFKTMDVILHFLGCFDYFGGIPEEVVIDQDKLMVVSENRGDIILTKDFKYFVEEMGFKMYVCRKADPESKGKVENLVGYVKNNFLAPRDFIDTESANTSVLEWLKRRANGKISQATKQVPANVIDEERKHLREIRNSIFRKDSLTDREERTVDDKGYLSFSSCSYMLPLKYRNKNVEIYATNHKLFAFDILTGEEIVEYDISLIPGKKITKREFQRDKEKTAKELKQSVVNLFGLENWKAFVSMNFKCFPRYVRDQCIDAKKYFSKGDIDEIILDKALEFCIGNETPSFANLNDTYKYYKHMHEESIKEIDVGKIVKDFYGAEHKTVKPIDVKRRNFTVYKSILKNRREG